MRLIVLSMLTLLMGTFLIIYGTLLAWRPELFLRFHDSFVDRGRWNKSTAWRKNVHNLNYKLLGVAFCILGLFIVFSILTKLMSNQN